MIIPVNLPDSGSSVSTSATLPPQLAQFGGDELVLIELQGSLEVEGDRRGQTVGKLRIDDATNKPTILIGHHLLEGKLVNLPKPIAVLHRSSKLESCTFSARTSDEDVLMNNNNEETQPKQQQVEWDLIAIVKRKMVFSRRPMPMVGKTPALVSDDKKAGKQVDEDLIRLE
ncbi:hypothetical protein AcV7_006281 [Taiwanofungus camphoratus]|nr:hypothetical protein AcV7_006281 [Antrodia cinnamomea]